MTERHLTELLERVTDDLPARDRGREALMRAARVRRTRATVGVGGGLSAIVIVAGALSSLPSTEPPAPRPGPSTASPTVAPSTTVSANADLDAPPIDPGVVQEEWDPADAIPAKDEPGLPASLTPPAEVPELTGMPRAAAVVMTESGLAAVDPTGGWQQLGLPEAQVANSVSTLALSVDGTTVSWAGRSAIWSRDVRGGPWRKVAYPDGMSPNGPREVSLVPQVAEMTYVGQNSRWWQLDLHTGDYDELSDHPGLRSFAWRFPGIAGLMDSDRSSDPDLFLSPGPSIDTSTLGTLYTLAARPDRVATLRHDSATESTAVLALDATTGEVIAMLPVGGLREDYIAGGWLRPVAWLDPQRVLLWVSSPTTQQQRLVTWDTRTGGVTQSSVLDPETEIWAFAPSAA